MSRDHMIWMIAFVASVLAFAASLADIIPPAYAPRVLAVSALMGFISGKLGNSPLPGKKDKPR
ncbi:hypothetical protein UFOVP1236_4 [uncultured Caudovirales phage]|uniref:Uncharacterized protein n=1 Tax=uncultured Caudovirales phage TaxID=2100421 RepID=A0A6J5R5L2_9CAUD|nr:hypothetical protein UFOVP1236_4 [uncultured Caudovirales phage]